MTALLWAVIAGTCLWAWLSIIEDELDTREDQRF